MAALCRWSQTRPRNRFRPAFVYPVGNECHMKKRLVELLAVAMLTVAALPAAAQDWKIPVDYFTLPNGLKVVVSEDHAAPVALVEVMYNIGFRVEPKGRT